MYKYIPSIYYFEAVKDKKGIRFVNVNSELTYINCHDWFGLQCGDEGNPLAYNLYTGWSVSNTTAEYTPTYYTGSNFIPIYNILYKWFSQQANYSIKCIASCHEIPFTVMTMENLAPAGSDILKESKRTQ
jgi:hypothetical protein